MKKNIWLIVFLVTSAVLAVVVVKQNQRIAEMKDQLTTAVAAAEKANAPRAEPAPAAKPKPTEPVPEAKPVEPASVPAPVPTPAPAAQATSGTGSNFFSGLATMMKNPQMKEMVRAQQKYMVDQMYGSLSKYLSLTPEQQEALQNLLSERQMAITEAGLSAIGGSGQDAKQAADEVKAVKAQYDQQIKDLLGPQDYQTFQDYEKTASDRVQLQMFKGSLPTDAALTDQQEYDLLNAMYQARQALPTSSVLNNKNSDPSQLTEENIAQAVKQMEQLQQAYANGAKPILTPAQYDAFMKWQEQMSSMQAAAMNMARQMFANKPAAQPSATSQGQTP